MKPRFIGNTPVITGSLKNMLARFGMDVWLYQELQEPFENTVDPQGVYNEVYGIFAGSAKQAIRIPIRALIPTSFFTISDNVFVSSFDSVFCWTLAPVNNGDIIEIPRDDLHVLRFKLVDVETIGMEIAVVTKFKLTPLGD
jgi:hypothetical protein